MHSTLFIISLLIISVIFEKSSRAQHVSFPFSGPRIAGQPWRWPNDTKRVGRFNQPNFFHLLKHKLKIQVLEKVPTTSGPTADCVCVPYYQCNNNNTIITDGVGVIDVRIRRCTGDLEVCCKRPSPNQRPSSMAPIVNPSVPPLIFETSPATIPPTQPPTTLPPTTLPPTTLPPTTLPPTTIPPTTLPPTTLPPTTIPPTTIPPTTFPPTTLPPTTLPPTTLPPTTKPPTTLPPTLPPTQPSSTRPPFPTLPPDCICVPLNQCGADGFVLVSGEGMINPRQTLLPCGENMICCRLPSTSIVYPAPPIITNPAPPIVVPCACVKNFQCDANGYIIVSGAGNILPRFPGARHGQIVYVCGIDEICCRYPPNGQDSLSGHPLIISNPPVLQYPSNPSFDSRLNVSQVLKNPGTSRECLCIKSWRCNPDFVVTIDGAGIIDPRFGLCMASDEVCCRSTGLVNNRGATSDNSGVPVSFVVNEPRFPNYVNSVVCGVRGVTCPSGSCTTTYGDTNFGEFPWMVALLIREPGGTNIFQCGASMINSRAILTAAHCVLNRKPGLLVARFGEWNTAHNDEPVPFQEADVQSIVTHPNYYSGGLYHDVAVLILATPVNYAVNVVPICLPQQAVIFMPGTRCLASGWGRSGFEGQYQTILKKVDLPIVEKEECQRRLRTTKLGQYFQLHGSFLCAGGEASRDTCTGDGGGPLVCPTSTGQFIQVGIISWGIGCGQSNVPAVYTDVVQHRQWIEQQLANHGVS